MQLRGRNCKKHVEKGTKVNSLKEITQSNPSLLEKSGTKFIYMSSELSWPVA